jgi:hypothetical protein
MRHQGQPQADWEIRQGIAKQAEIDNIEAGKPQGDGPPPVPPATPAAGGHAPQSAETAE